MLLNLSCYEWCTAPAATFEGQNGAVCALMTVMYCSVLSPGPLPPALHCLGAHGTWVGAHALSGTRSHKFTSHTLTHPNTRLAYAVDGSAFGPSRPAHCARCRGGAQPRTPARPQSDPAGCGCGAAAGMAVGCTGTMPSGVGGSACACGLFLPPSTLHHTWVCAGQCLFASPSFAPHGQRCVWVLPLAALHCCRCSAPPPAKAKVTLLHMLSSRADEPSAGPSTPL